MFTSPILDPNDPREKQLDDDTETVSNEDSAEELIGQQNEEMDADTEDLSEDDSVE